MHPFIRGEKPSCLQDEKQVERWTKQWIDAGGEFSWRNHQSDIAERAAEDTHDHCSYCDELLPRPRTIDHLRPKRRTNGYPELAYEWSNLYLCCTDCQTRLGDYTNDVLAPDDPLYRFDDYFTVNADTFAIEALPGPNEARAVKTIEHLRFENPKRSLGVKRKRGWKLEQDENFNERRFRFLWGPPTDDPAQDQRVFP